MPAPNIAPNPIEKHTVNSELQAVFDPIAHEVAATIQGTNTANLLETTKEIPRLELANDDATANLPWDIFQGIDTGLLESPPSDDEDWKDRIYPVLQLAARQKADRRTGVAILTRVLEDSIYNGDTPFDPARWKKHEDQIAALPEAEQLAFEEARKIRVNNVAKWQHDDPRIRRTESVLYAYSDSVSPNKLVNQITLPVSAYGVDFTNKLIGSALAINTKVREVIQPAAPAIAAQHEELLSQYTARAKDDGATGETVINTSMEGVLSIAQALAILTAEKVEGYDDPVMLAQDLVASGLVQKLARYSPLGFVGPMALSGRYFPGALEKTEDSLQFSGEFRDYLKDCRTRYMGEIATRQEIGKAIKSERAGVCPVSGAEGGIQSLADTFVVLLNEK